ncbi:hypothetical protein EMQ25_08885 [Arsenicitalea aurantiaca]|uniref:Surface antigen domain-containing protein n=1 Tax=Arsenicitalea aurantiaca TaxID=1783274 RepID=A0A433XA83_9HYPH|nr:hypothetical protein [Arsenicitalea aurantiaca]RUT30985.1 hypothetical protein EMQ25_08885 [Arsenicitalea aurantiaca]
MHAPRIAFPLIALLALAGCTGMGPSGELRSGPTLSSAPMTALPEAPVQTASLTPPPVTNPVQAQATAQAMTDGLAFLDPQAVSLLSTADRGTASTAQFNALQFGRPGAPRTWSGSGGTAGSITVGPYVRVNNIDCRDFTHTVTRSGQSYAKSGTACRESDGRWTVAS